MQANCCVFPAPSQFQFTNIINKIVLIPKQPATFAYYYHDKYLIKSFNEENQFMNHIRGRKEISNSTVDATCQTYLLQKKFQVYSSLKEKASKAANQLKSTAFYLEETYNHTNIQKITDEIPCIFIPSKKNDKIMVFFHGNGQDLSTSYQFAYYISKQVDISILVIQYQGYSIYQGKSNPNNIVMDSTIVIQFLVSVGYQSKDIVIFGRSIGGAIAFQVASKFKVCCLILLSPFLSLKKVAEDLYGKIASSILKDTFDNASTAQNVECPILIIHGLKDSLVPFQHSISILKQCKGYSQLKLVENMTHTKFNFNYDFIQPVKKFFHELEVRKQ